LKNCHCLRGNAATPPWTSLIPNEQNMIASFPGNTVRKKFRCWSWISVLHFSEVWFGSSTSEWHLSRVMIGCLAKYNSLVHVE
jgi:hypothetical protein